MAERLTKQKTTKGITKAVVKHCVDTMQMIIDKLCAFEDILEKYGIESVEELDKLTDGMKSTISVLLDRNKNTKQDRNTWQKACELACQNISVVQIITNDDIESNIDNLPKYFYEKAKKELKNE